MNEEKWMQEENLAWFMISRKQEGQSFSITEREGMGLGQMHWLQGRHKIKSICMVHSAVLVNCLGQM